MSVATTQALPRPEAPLMTFATSLLIFVEAAFFVGLLSAYIVLRSQFSNWPPMGQPRLPVEVTALNTLLLLASGVVAWRWPVWLDDARRLTRGLRLSLMLGAAFLAIQGVEWARLLANGLSVSDDVYGGLFVVIVGSHAAHVVGAMIVLGFATARAQAGAYTRASWDGLRAVRMFWLFVVVVWPVLYALVYLW